MLKADLHIHTKEDAIDNIKYNVKQLIDYASKLKFDVISITNHDTYTFSEELAKYAKKKKGILLIPGIELRIQGKEVLLYNFTEEQIERIKTFEDLRKLKSKDNLVIAPHPFFVKKQCLKNRLIKYIDLFDAIEYSYFYTKHINFNKKSINISKKYKKALIGTSDMHHLWQMGYTYSLIKAEKNIKDVFEAIKKNKIGLKTRALPYYRFITAGVESVYGVLKDY